MARSIPPSEREHANRIDNSGAPGSKPNIPGSGELVVEIGGVPYRIGEVPEAYRDRHKPQPNEVVIRSDEDLQKILDEE